MRNVLTTALTAAVVGAGLACVGPASAATITTSVSVYATDDAYVSSKRRTMNSGQVDKLVVGRSGGETRVSYVKFTVRPPASGTRMSGVELRLPLAGTPPTSTLTLMRVPNSAWSERTLTAAKTPRAGTVIGSARVSASSTVARFNLSRVITGPGTYSFALKSSSASAVTRLRSVEHGHRTSGGPELKISLVRSAPVRPPTTPPTTSPVGNCVTGALLVPSCGVLWGAAAGGFTDTPRDVALKAWEATTGRTSTIFHQYHKGDEKFPTAAEIAMTRDPGKPRVLLLNWKVAYGSTWAKVAAGEKDARINAWADHINANYTEKFFLALHHEPENDVQVSVSSGMTAKDYAAMYRHVITLLRAKGVDNAVNVVAYMGNEKWMAQSWWADLYPGDEYVDWIGIDSYVSVEKGYYHYGMFNDLLDRQPTGGGTGWYDWASTKHPNKPIMVAEWGMYHRTSVTVDKAAAFDTVLPELKKRPNIKAVVYFDTEADDEGDRNISVATTPNGLAAFKKLAADPIFNVTLRRQ
jgi:beta-mannanase